MQRQTKQRTAIMETLKERRYFRSAQELHEDLRLSGINIGLATVYRALQKLAETQMVDVVRTPEGESKYRACNEAEHHHHLVCRQCGRTQEFALENFESALVRMAERAGFCDLTHDIEVFGLCHRCSKETHD